MLMAGGIRLVLASQSPIRRKLLADAGLVFDAVSSGVDEEAVREALFTGGESVDPVDIAEILARAKAEAVARREVADFVIGADQVLSLGDEIFSKPPDMDAARRQLFKLKGRTHQLHSAVVIVRADEPIWSQASTVDIAMRDYSPEFVGRYLAAAGDEALSCVGCYQFEGLGVQLIDSVEGDYFSVLGLPLLPLMATLRRLSVCET